MRRARKTWAQIAEEQAQFQAVDQKPLGWTARKKAHAQSEQQVARAKARISGLLGLVGNAIELRNQASLASPCGCSLSTVRSTPCRQPTYRNPLCWLNVGHQMIADPHDRALKSFSAE